MKTIKKTKNKKKFLWEKRLTLTTWRLQQYSRGYTESRPSACVGCSIFCWFVLFLCAFQIYWFLLFLICYVFTVSSFRSYFLYFLDGFSSFLFIYFPFLFFVRKSILYIKLFLIIWQTFFKIWWTFFKREETFLNIYWTFS